MLPPSDKFTLEFWAAVGVALLVKITSSRSLGWRGVIVSSLVGIGSAYAFSEPVADYLGVNLTLMAGLLTLTGEGLMRTVFQVANDPADLKQWVALWRSGRLPDDLDR